MKSRKFYVGSVILFIGVIFFFFNSVNTNEMKDIIKKYNLIEDCIKRIELNHSKDLVMGMAKDEGHFVYLIIVRNTNEELRIHSFPAIDSGFYTYDEDLRLRKMHGIHWAYGSDDEIKMHLLMGIMYDPAVTEIMVQDYENTKQYQVNYLEYNGINFFYLFEEDYEKKLMPIHIKAYSGETVVYDNKPGE